MSDMVERVAKALRSGMEHSGVVSLVANGPHGEAGLEQFFEVLAMDAIEAMRGPLTQEMGLAFTRYWHDNFRDDHVFEDTPAQECWEGMIDAALQAPAGAG